MLLATLVSIAGVLFREVSAHGSVTSYNINGVEYPGFDGYNPGRSPPSIQRQWPSYDPIMSVSDAKMRCNGGTTAALNATLEAGQNVTAKWVQWTHSQGPVMVWLFKCAGAFSACTGDGKGWFKIDELGLTKPPLNSNNWGTDVVLRTKKWTTTIPKLLAAGNYLIRHELLALHQSNTPQFYPECAQIVVTGGGGQLPGDAFLTAIPSYATASDPGVRVDIYMGNLTSYKCPGPAVWVPDAVVPPVPTAPVPVIPTVSRTTALPTAVPTTSP